MSKVVKVFVVLVIVVGVLYFVKQQGGPERSTSPDANHGAAVSFDSIPSEPKAYYLQYLKETSFIKSQDDMWRVVDKYYSPKMAGNLKSLFKAVGSQMKEADIVASEVKRATKLLVDPSVGNTIREYDYLGYKHVELSSGLSSGGKTSGGQEIKPISLSESLVYKDGRWYISAED